MEIYPFRHQNKFLGRFVLDLSFVYTNTYLLMSMANSNPRIVEVLLKDAKKEMVSYFLR